MTANRLLPAAIAGLAFAGAVKDAAGKMMDDKKLQAEGKMDKAKGEAREALGPDAKDAVKHVRIEH
jgi:uncharacterized protein YjbJ (UPF0337 family)